MRIPMDRVTRDFLLFFRIRPSQCSPNLFNIVNNIAWLNEKMNIDLTHQDMNRVYSCHDSSCSGYYL